MHVSKRLLSVNSHHWSVYIAASYRSTFPVITYCLYERRRRVAIMRPCTRHGCDTHARTRPPAYVCANTGKHGRLARGLDVRVRDGSVKRVTNTFQVTDKMARYAPIGQEEATGLDSFRDTVEKKLAARRARQFSLIPRPSVFPDARSWTEFVGL